MNSKAASKYDPLNIAKWGVVALLVAVGVVGNQLFSDDSLLYRVLALLVLGGVAAFVALATTQGVAFATLVKEAKIEIRKVVWPTHQEAVQTSLMVIIVTIIISLFLAVVDWAIGSMVRSLLSGG